VLVLVLYYLKQAENNRVEKVLLNGKRFDCGSIEDYVEAIKYVALTYNFN
jgi:UTP-glucose-1-phosphate uridylyltransferase